MPPKPQKPVKILELSGEAWQGGLSIDRFSSMGGLYKVASKFDPFEKRGVYVSASKAKDRTGIMNLPPKYSVGWSDGTNSQFYLLADNKAWSFNSSTFVAQGETSNIVGIDPVRGAIKFKDRILYAEDATVYSNYIPVSSSQTTILAGLETTEHMMHIGPDRRCYLTNNEHVARITNVDGTTGNDAEYLTFEEDVICRDLTDDGKRLVIVGDTNNDASTDGRGSFRCFVAFWNMKSQDLTQYWEFDDERLFAVARSEDEIIVFGSNNLYTCSISSRPKPISSFRNNVLGTIPGSISIGQIYPASVINRNSGEILWSTSGRTFGYGRPDPYSRKILFELGNETSQVKTYCNFFNGLILFSGNDNAGDTNPQLTDWYSGDADEAIVTMAEVDFKRPYRLAYAKVVFRTVLSFGTTMSLEILSVGGGSTLLRNTTVSFANDGAIRSKMLYPKPDSTTTASMPLFEETYTIQLKNTGCEIKRLELWATPAPEHQQT